LSVCTVDKSKVEISQNFVAFSEYTNFTRIDGSFGYIHSATIIQGRQLFKGGNY
jgi:hypothetical protein